MANFFSFGGLGDLRASFVESVAKSVESPLGGSSNTGDGRSVTSDLRDRFSIDFVGGEQRVLETPVVNSPSFKIAESKDSTTGPYSALFNNFKLKAIPNYNFFTEDEETNNRMTRSGRKLEDIPRYVHLKWQPAPVTDKPPAFSTPPPGVKGVRSNSFVVDERVQPLARRGIMFDKEAAEQFTVVKDSLSNGFITPGVIRAIVELPLTKAGLVTPRLTPKIDEQLFLKAPCTEGLSIHDLQNNVNVRFNGMLNAADVGVQVMSDNLKGMQEALFDGQFSVSKVTVPKRSFFSKFTNPASYVIRDIASTSPGMKINLNASAGSATAAGSKKDSNIVEDMMFETVSESAQPDSESDFTEVNFIDPAITGLVNKDKVDLISAPEHAESCAALGQFLPNLCMMSELHNDVKKKKDIPSFPAVQESVGTKYVGYIIEKYAQGRDGVFQLIEEIEIPDCGCSEYVDAAVVYGGVYRYRMKGILRWTRKGNVNHKGFEEGNFFDEDFTQSKGLASFKSSYFASDWNRKWQYAAIIDIVEPNPPDEFVVRPESHKGRAVLTWKVPHNPQRDLRYYRLFKKLKNEKGKDITDWELLDIILGDKNVLYIDNEVESFQDEGETYVYAVQSVTHHNEFSNLSCQRGVRINREWKFSGEFSIINVANEGVPLNAVGAFSHSPVKRFKIRNHAKEAVLFTSRPGYHKNPFLDGSYCLRIESLDTGEIKDIVINTEYTAAEPDIKEQANTIYVAPDPAIRDEAALRDYTDSTFGYARSGADKDMKVKGGIKGHHNKRSAGKTKL